MPYTFSDLEQELFEKPRTAREITYFERLEENYKKGSIDGVKRYASQLVENDAAGNCSPDAVNLLKLLAETGTVIKKPGESNKLVTALAVSPGSQTPRNDCVGGRLLTERVTQSDECVDEALRTLVSEQAIIAGKMERALNASSSEVETLKAENREIKKNLDHATKELQSKEKELQSSEAKANELYGKLLQANQTGNEIYKQNQEAGEYIRKLENRLKKRDEEMDKLSQNVRDLDYELFKSKEEVNNLRTRLNKKADEKINEGNSDVTDLRDPQRPIRLSDEFGCLYDDEWTDCFVALTEKFKRLPEEAIKYLLCVLQDSFEFCNQLQFQQLDILKNVLLYPDHSEDHKLAQKKPNRIHSREMNELLKLRRQISSTSEETILQQFLQHAQKQLKDKNEDVKVMSECLPYYTKCVQLCWLMVLHNPPLYMKFDAKAGDAFDMNLYREYGQSGDKFQFLVWPPLFVEKDGGLLSKGVAQPVGKKSKKR